MVAEGSMRNCSPDATGTVLSGMTCAAVGATATAAEATRAATLSG
jgi:hypothetical protein